LLELCLKLGEFLFQVAQQRLEDVAFLDSWCGGGWCGSSGGQFLELCLELGELLLEFGQNGLEDVAFLDWSGSWSSWSISSWGWEWNWSWSWSWSVVSNEIASRIHVLDLAEEFDVAD